MGGLDGEGWGGRGGEGGVGWVGWGGVQGFLGEPLECWSQLSLGALLLWFGPDARVGFCAWQERVPNSQLGACRRGRLAAT